jgi:hypothetical protein
MVVSPKAAYGPLFLCSKIKNPVKSGKGGLCMNRIYVQTAVLTKVKDAQFQKPHCILWCFDDWHEFMIYLEDLSELMAIKPQEVIKLILEYYPDQDNIANLLQAAGGFDFNGDWQSISKEELNSLLAEEPAYNSAVMPLN